MHIVRVIVQEKKLLLLAAPLRLRGSWTRSRMAQTYVRIHVICAPNERAYM